MGKYRHKLTFFFIIFAVFLLSLTTYLVYAVSIKRQTEDLRNRILGIVRLASIKIDVDKVSRIKPRLESEDTIVYKEVWNTLEVLRRTDPLIDSVYIMVRSDDPDIFLFLVDSGDKERISAFCGEKYDVSRLNYMKEGFTKPSVDKKLTVDKWGTFLSGYAPLYDSKGEAIAIICVDVSAESIIMMRMSLAKRFILVLLLGLIISLISGWLIARNLTNPLKILTSGVRDVGKGNLEKNVEISTRDELEELANAFNKMTADLKDSRLKLEKYYLDTIHSLARIIEAKDPYTKGHSERVAEYAVELGRYMKLPEKDIRLLHEAALLHDIGKVGVHEGILTKVEPLTKQEWEEIKTHPQVGEDILKFFEFLQPGLAIIADHHERPDGKGYPKGLVSGQIPQLASIVAVVDSFDAMTTDRSYRKAFSFDEAILRLNEGKGKQFDPQVVDAFVHFLKEKKSNSA
ncbi:MAG: HD domain-containing protein [Candidatus Omnitrophica bacterium]|nr:HD domain-containing protein [Candidatus Omnitrophota bacterium]